MNSKLACCTLTLTCLAVALPAQAQLAVSTNRMWCVFSEIVHTTTHNAGPSTARLVSDPPVNLAGGHGSVLPRLARDCRHCS